MNGGAVEWQRFYTGAGTVKISQASNYDFFTIDVIAEALPSVLPKEEPLLKYGLWWAVGENDDIYYELRDDGTGAMVYQYEEPTRWETKSI